MSTQFLVIAADYARQTKFAGVAPWALTVALIATAQPAAAQDDVKAAIAWFDTLGYPDLSKAQLVKVATGQFRSGDGLPPAKEFRPAFLITTEGESFKVLTLGLKTEWYTSSDNGSELSRVGYEVVDLKKSVGDYLNSLAKDRNSDEYGRFLDARLAGYVEPFVLARACEQRGLAEESKALFRRVKKDFSDERVEKAESFRQDVIDHLAQKQLLAAVNDFANPKLTRPELLAKFEKIIKNYPAPKQERYGGWSYGGHQGLAKIYVRILKKMIAEDDEYARKPPKPEKELTKKERIADLIFRLRDQADLAEKDDESILKSGPAAELVKIGFDAVPQLIAILDDERFTRVVEYRALNLYWDVSVLRIGGCARMILEQLAGRWAGRGLVSDGSTKSIQAWWADIQKKGEKQTLIDVVQAAKPGTTSQAIMLREKFPDAAFDALAKGIENAEDDQTKSYLIDVLAGIKGDRPVPLLRQQLKKSPALCVRLAAAEGLSRRGIDDGVRPMIDEWQRLARSASDGDDLDSLISFLVKCGRPEAIKALGADLLNRSGSVQIDIVESVGNLGQDNSDRLPFAVSTARDELLVQSLANTERSRTAGHWGSERQVDDPRYCDLAAYYLSVLWKLPQPFDFHSPLLTRERYRIDLVNTWRERQGLQLLPIPASHRVKRLPDAVVKPKLDALLGATNDADRQKAIAAIEELGLPALPAAREFLAGTKPDHPAYAELRKMVLRLACIVREIEFSRFSARPDKETQETLDRFKGKPLDIEGLARMSLKITDPLPKGIEGIAVEMDREGDDSGVTLTVTLVKGDRQKGTFNTSTSVRVDGRRSMGQLSTVERRLGIWQDFKSAMQKAFDLGPEKNVFGRARIALIE